MFLPHTHSREFPSVSKTLAKLPKSKPKRRMRA